MALNEVFKLGQYISLPVPEGTKSGDPIRVGALNGVAIVDEGTGGNAAGFTSVDLSGAHKFVIEDAEVGDVVYITSAGDLTTTASGNSVFGVVTHIDPRVEDRVVVLTQSISV